MKIKFTLMSMVFFAISFGSIQAQTVKDKFKDAFLIGTALSGRQINEGAPEQTELIKNEFNVLTAENDMKSSLIHPERDKYNFETADKLFALAKKNNQKIHGHTFIWHSQLSRFMQQSKDSTELATMMEEHISTIGGRYKGQVHSWDVVNEAVNDDGSLRKSVFLNVMGESFLPLAFKLAAKADPDALLYYNDYSMTGAPKRAGVIKMVKMIQDSGAKIDGIGMQGHWNLETPSIQDIEESIIQYAALGVKISITELDIDVLPNPRNVSGADISQSAQNSDALNPYKDGLPAEIEEKLAKRYAEIFALFYKHRDKIERVTFWGVNDGNSWKNGFPVRGRTNYPLLFDRNNQRKKAYEAIMALDLKKV